MRSEGLFEMNGKEKLNFMEVHTCKKNNFLLNNKYDFILFQLLIPYRKRKRIVGTELFFREFNEYISINKLFFPVRRYISIKQRPNYE